jgi:hypothetical protein
MTDRLTQRSKLPIKIKSTLYALAQEQNNGALMTGGCKALESTFYFLGEFETAGQYAMRGVQIWRSGDVQSQVEENGAPAVECLCCLALSEASRRDRFFKGGYGGRDLLGEILKRQHLTSLRFKSSLVSRSG